MSESSHGPLTPDSPRPPERQAQARTVPHGVWVPAAFFVAAGVLEMALAFVDLRTPAFWPLWEALGRSLLHLILAVGLWNRIALCRSIAMIYCLAILSTYAFVFVLAFAQAPVQFPPYVVWQSFYQIPSCALLFPYLRSPEVGLLYTRPLF